jgi:putative membrane protein
MNRPVPYRVLRAATLCLVFAMAPVLAQDQPGATPDAQFVLKASAAGLAEVDAANLALKQANNADVKKFAQHMIEGHTKANKQLLKLADSKRLAPAPSADPMHMAELRQLAALNGEAFDRAYMQGQVKDHVEAVALFEQEAKSGSDPAIKEWAAKTLPTLKEHLKMARDIDGKLKDTGKSK